MKYKLFGVYEKIYSLAEKTCHSLKKTKQNKKNQKQKEKYCADNLWQEANYSIAEILALLLYNHSKKFTNKKTMPHIWCQVQ